MEDAMLRRLLVAALLVPLFGVQLAVAQVTVSGSVTDAASGESLPGANVIITELNMGTSADIDGNYRITNVPAGSYTIQATFVGYEPFSAALTVGNNDVVRNIAMQPGAIGLDELVVTGYGVQRKRDELAASTRVDASEIERLPVVSAEQALQGRAAGVAIQSNSGQPGAGMRIQVRGVGSINAGSDPLYIVDGVQMEVGTGLSSQAASSALNAINPADIESIEVLKDAAATAIYGAQAANGVVLITTKRGRSGQTRFNLSTQLGSVDEIGRYDVLSGREWVELMHENYDNYARVLGLDRNQWRQFAEEDFGTPDSAPNYDWQEEIYRVGQLRKVDLSVSGGTDATRFYLAGGYHLTEGQLIRSMSERYSLLANFDHRVNDRFNLEARLRGSTTDQFGAIADGNFINGPFFAASLNSPIEPIYNEDGSFAPSPSIGYNVVEGVMLEERKGRTNAFGGSLAGNYGILSNLYARAFFGINYQNVRDTNFRPPEIPAFSSYGGSLLEADREVLTYNTNLTLSYFETLNDVHNLNFVGGGEYRFSNWEQYAATGRGFPSGLFQTMDLAAVPYSVTGSYTEYKMASLFGRAEYDFDNKYLFSASVRYDGSSRFGADTKYGLFYALSAAWEMAEEPFMQGASFITRLKPRISYGVTGNSDISNFASRSLFGSGGSYLGQPGLRPSQLGNNILTWEEAATFNVGLDYSLFNDRIYGAIDAYRRRNNELLLARQLPLDAGFSTINENVGIVQNEGLEFEISTVNVQAGDFTWRTDFNIAFLRNEVIELNEGQEEIGDIAVGRPLGSYRVYNFAGINPADGRSMWYDADGNITYDPVEDDRIWVGNIYPDYWGGIGNTLSYGGLSLNVFLQFNMGQETFLQQQGYFLRDPSQIRNMERPILRRWQEPGDLTDTPKLFPLRAEPGMGSNITASNRFIEDVSYLRVKNVQLSYTLPSRFAQAAGVFSASLFLQGQNLHTWTAYSGIDPEMTGTQNAIYPQNKTWTLGLNLQF